MPAVLRCVCVALAIGPLGVDSRALRFGSRMPRSSSSGGGGDADEQEQEHDNSLSSTIAELCHLVPRFTYTLNPETCIKIRKRFTPLLTELSVGGDFDPRNQVWTFRTDWVDTIIGGTLALSPPMLQWSKSLYFPGVYDVATRLKFLASIDLRTAETRTGLEVSLRRSAVTQNGLQLERKIPLDGPDGHFKLGVVGAVDFPEVIGITGGGATGLNASDVQIGLNLKRLDLLVDF